MPKKLPDRESRSTKTTPKKRQSARTREDKPAESAIDTTWHKRFLKILGTTCNVTLAADAAGIDRGTAYDHRARFPAFARAWEDAKDAAIELLEAEAWQRARKKSDTLMIFLLKAHRPEKYRESVDVNLKKLSDEELIARVTAALGGDGAAGADPS